MQVEKEQNMAILKLFFSGDIENINHNTIQKIVQCGTIEEMRAALDEVLKKQEKERLVISRFGDPKPVEKKKAGKNTITYWKVETYDGGKRKQITAVSREALIDKVYTTMEVSLRKSITLREMFEIVHANRVQSGICSSNTTMVDRPYWNRFFENDPIANMKIIDIQVSDVKKYSERLVGYAKMDRKTYSKAKTLLNMIFDEAVEEDLIQNNPSRAYVPRKLKFKLPKNNYDNVYSPSERQKILKYVKSLPQTVYTLAVRFAFCFCMRIGELRALTWDDIEDEGYIHIWREVIHEERDGKKRCDVLVEHTKNNRSEGERWVPISDEAWEVLGELRKINGDKKFILQGNNGAEFSISSNRFNEHLRMYCEEAGVRYLSSHKIRFYGITSLYEAGVPESHIQRIAGHCSPEMTRHYNRSHKRNLVSDEVWESIFGGRSTEVNGV